MTLPLSYAKSLIKSIVPISDTLFQVRSYLVKINIKKGRRVLTCSCTNHSRFPVESFCYHKESVIIYLANKELNNKLDKLIQTYEKYKELNFDVKPGIVLDELNKLKKL